MKSIVRACGAAAAALALAATATYADPSIAGASSAEPTATYLDHASAMIDGAGVEADAGMAPVTGSGLAADETSEHVIANLVADLMQSASAIMPGQQSLDALVVAYSGMETTDREQECLAGAVYFEARSEPLEGQLAVAEVVINRAASGRYPTSLCDVITQKAQFSFIQRGKFPPIQKGSEAWRKAVAIANIAQARLIARVPSDVLWYHADYVAPIWRHGLTRVTKIGAHIFYS